MLAYEVRQFVETVLLVFAALFPIVNPIGAAPVFLAMTPGIDRPSREKLARTIGVNAFILLLGSMILGGYVIEFFGLSVPVVQVAGGALVSAVAWQLLRTGEGTQEAPSVAVSPDDLAVRAFYPLTMPLTVGPGSIAAAITLGAHSPHTTVRAIAVTVLAAATGVLLVATTVYVMFRFADRMAKVLGPTGTTVVLKLTAFILLCIGVQIVWNGLFVLLGTVPTIRPR
jgi:multiple antibiotic resistance protein